MVTFKDIQSLSRTECDGIRCLSEPVRIAIAAGEIQKICDKSTYSQFFPFGGEGYKSSVKHYMESSSDIAFAAVQPGSVDDLSKIIRILGLTKAPFAVKGGGHTSNPNFSSTKGIQISMARFNKIKFNNDEETLDVEAGCLWDEVYRALNGTGRNVVGGSGIAGVGIAGWLLGGGYSLKTNQYGLGIDNILGIRIVLPNGDIDYATKIHNRRLLNAVRGGGNNFGIVTGFTLKTHKQAPAIFGGVCEYDEEEVDEVKDAIVDFVDNCKDPKAAFVAAFRYYNKPGGIQFKLTVQYFYDDPEPLESPFQKFFDISHNRVLTGGAGTGQEQPGTEKNTVLSYFELDHALSEINDDSITDVNERKLNVEDFKDKVVPYLHKDGNHDPHEFASEYECKNLGIHDAVDTIGYYPPASDTTQLGYPPAPDASQLEYYISAPVIISRTGAVVALGSRFGNASLFPRDTTKRSSSIALNLKEEPKIVSFPLRAMHGVGENPRGRWGNVMLPRYTRDVVNEIERQAKKAAKHLITHHGRTVIIDIWPFVPELFQNSDHEAAWPHGEPNGPLVAIFQWEGLDNDKFWIEEMKRALSVIEKKVYKPGEKRAPVYVNNSLAERTTVEAIYGENLIPLGKFRKEVDPEDVMGQTGGYKIPLLD